MPLVDEERSARTVNFDWLCASPRTRLFALKSAYKFNFRHNGAPRFAAKGEERRTKVLPLSDAESPEDIKTPRQRANSSFPSYPPRATRRDAQAPPLLTHHTVGSLEFARATRGSNIGLLQSNSDSEQSLRSDHAQLGFRAGEHSCLNCRGGYLLWVGFPTYSDLFDCSARCQKRTLAGATN